MGGNEDAPGLTGLMRDLKGVLHTRRGELSGAELHDLIDRLSSWHGIDPELASQLVFNEIGAPRPSPCDLDELSRRPTRPDFPALPDN